MEDRGQRYEWRAEDRGMNGGQRTEDRGMNERRTEDSGLQRTEII